MPGLLASSASRDAAERLDAARVTSARAAAYDERARIARELHDVIAHSVSVMVIQAGGARLVMGEQPERAEESLRSVERAGREALAEMRRLLGILGDGDPHALAPQPGLRDIARCSRTRRSQGSRPISASTAPASGARRRSTCARTGSCRRR